MRRNALALLAVLNLLLLGAIAWLWITPGGELRNMQWQAPSPVKVDLHALLPSLPGPGQSDTSQFLRMLERPLFSVTRRPRHLHLRPKWSPPSPSTGLLRQSSPVCMRGRLEAASSFSTKARIAGLRSTDIWTAGSCSPSVVRRPLLKRVARPVSFRCSEPLLPPTRVCRKHGRLLHHPARAAGEMWRRCSRLGRQLQQVPMPLPRIVLVPFLVDRAECAAHI